MEKMNKFQFSAGGSQEKIPGTYDGVGGCPELSFWEIFLWLIDYFLTQVSRDPALFVIIQNIHDT